MESAIGVIYTCITTGYNVKYSLEKEGMVRVSVPGAATTIPLGSTLDEKFRLVLSLKGWTPIAIDSLEKNILNRKGGWVNCATIDPKTGDITK